MHPSPTTSLLLLLALSCSACASYQGIERPTLSSQAYDGLLAAAPLAKNFEFRYEFRHGGVFEEEHSHEDLADEDVRWAIVRALKEDRLVNSEGPYKSKLSVTLIHNEDSSTWLNALATLTLLVIPTFAEETYTLEVALTETDGTVYETRVEASVKTLFQLLLFLYAPFNDWSIEDDTLQALIRQACLELVAKRSLHGS